MINRDTWLKDAEAAEKSEPSAKITCAAIVHATVAIGVEDVDREQTWIADADEAIKRQCYETARAIYAHTLEVFPGAEDVWLKAAQLEKLAGTRESLDALLRRAVTYCPQAEILWLMGAKEKWLSGDIAGSRAILQEAFASNPDSEEIWLAAFKLVRARERTRLRAAPAMRCAALFVGAVVAPDQARQPTLFPFDPFRFRFAGVREQRAGARAHPPRQGARA